jgi:hypothetical protein
VDVPTLMTHMDTVEDTIRHHRHLHITEVRPTMVVVVDTTATIPTGESVAT